MQTLQSNQKLKQVTADTWEGKNTNLVIILVFHNLSQISSASEVVPKFYDDQTLFNEGRTTCYLSFVESPYSDSGGF